MLFIFDGSWMAPMLVSPMPIAQTLPSMLVIPRPIVPVVVLVVAPVLKTVLALVAPVVLAPAAPVVVALGNETSLRRSSRLARGQAPSVSTYDVKGQSNPSSYLGVVDQWVTGWTSSATVVDTFSKYNALLPTPLHGQTSAVPAVFDGYKSDLPRGYRPKKKAKKVVSHQSVVDNKSWLVYCKKQSFLLFETQKEALTSTVGFLANVTGNKVFVDDSNPSASSGFKVFVDDR
jgi:hypothetical protein